MVHFFKIETSFILIFFTQNNIEITIRDYKSDKLFNPEQLDCSQA